MTDVTSNSTMEGVDFGVDRAEKADRMSANNGRHIKLTSTPQVVVPLTNLNYVDSAIEVLKSLGKVLPVGVADSGKAAWVNETINSLDVQERMDVLSEIKNRTAFWTKTVSLFLKEDSVEAYNNSIPEGTPNENGLGRIGKSVKLQVRFDKNQISELADTDPVAWFLENQDTIKGRTAITFSNDYAIKPEERFSFVVRDADGAEVIIETTKAQAKTINEMVGMMGHSWRGNRWSLAKTGSGLQTKMVVRYVGAAEAFDDEDDFLPQYVDYTNRVFGVPVNETETRKNLMIAIVGRPILDTMKPSWYTA